MKEAKSAQKATKEPRPTRKVIGKLHRVDRLLHELDKALKALEREPLDADDVKVFSEEIKTLTKGRDSLASELKADVYKKYKTILMRYRETAVVNIIDHTCQGCHVELPTSHLTKFISKDQIQFCPNCGRCLIAEGE